MPHHKKPLGKAPAPHRLPIQASESGKDGRVFLQPRAQPAPRCGIGIKIGTQEPHSDGFFSHSPLFSQAKTPTSSQPRGG